MAIFGEAGPDPEGGRGSVPGFRRKARWHSLKATRLSLLHNYRGSGGRGQSPASAGAPEPGAAGVRGVPARRPVPEAATGGDRRCRWRGVRR